MTIRTAGIALLLLAFLLLGCSSIPCCDDSHDIHTVVLQEPKLPIHSFIIIHSLSYYKEKCDKKPCVTRWDTTSAGGVAVLRATSDPNVGIIFSAKHVCAIMMKSTDKDYIGHRFIGYSSKNKSFGMLRYMSHPRSDLCAFITNELPVGVSVVTLASSPPAWGDRVYNISTPRGFSAGRPIFSGFFSGMYYESQVITVTTDRGSSGSPVFNSSAQLIGIIWSYPTTDKMEQIVEQLAYAISLNDLKELFNKIQLMNIAVSIGIEAEKHWTTTSTIVPPIP